MLLRALPTIVLIRHSLQNYIIGPPYSIIYSLKKLPLFMPLHSLSPLCANRANYIYKMEEESSKTQEPLPKQGKEQLKQLLVATYRGRTTQDTKAAHQVLLTSCRSPGFIQQLAALLVTPQPLDIKKAAASVLKNYASDVAHSQADKSEIIEVLFGAVMSLGVQTKVKEVLGAALEHLFNYDQQAVYKNVVKERVLQTLQEDNVNNFDGCIVTLNAHFNSLLAQPQQLFDFFCEILQPLAAKGLQLYDAITKMSMEEWLVKDRLILPTVVLLFDFLEFAVNQFNEQEVVLGDDLKQLRQNQFLITLLQSYLLLFHHNHSIISQTYPTVNSLKATVAAAANSLYSEDFCPQKLFQVVFLTVLSECGAVVEEAQTEQVLVECLSILEAHLARNSFASLFHLHKMELVFALFMYSATSQTERDAIIDDPQFFAQLAQDYTEGSGKSTLLKVRAACLLRVFAERIDQAPRNILEIILVILSGSVGTQQEDTQLMRCVKGQFSRFDFYGLSAEQKVETSLMILAALAPQINLREDMNKVVYAFFFTQFEALVKIDSPLVVLRIIRAISYYPSALYFLYIETHISRGGVFVLEGVKALQRVLRTNKFSELFQFLSSIFTKLLGVVRVEDPVMELIVINYHEQMLKVNPELYRLCRSRIKESFFQAMESNIHAALICFNLLYSLLKKEKDAQIFALLQKDFYDIAGFLQEDGQQKLYWRYEQKLIETYQLIIQRSYNISSQAEKFALRSLRFLSRQEKGTQMFRFYNTYLVKLDGAIFKLDTYFRAFWGEAQERYRSYLHSQTSLHAFTYYCFLLSEILANHCEIILTQQDLRVLLEMTERVGEEEKQYPLMVLLTYLYAQPYPTVNFLKQSAIYDRFLQGITRVRFTGRVPKKVYNLAYIMLLEIEENPQYVRKILLQCIHNLKVLNQRTRQCLTSHHPLEVKPRRLNQERSPAPVQEAIEQDDNDTVNPFIKFKHPFEVLSQFDQFKVKFWMNEHLMNDIDADLKADLRTIIETEVIDRTKLRIIRKVKRQ